MYITEPRAQVAPLLNVRSVGDESSTRIDCGCCWFCDGTPWTPEPVICAIRFGPACSSRQEHKTTASKKTRRIRGAHPTVSAKGLTGNRICRNFGGFDGH